MPLGLRPRFCHLSHRTSDIELGLKKKKALFIMVKHHDKKMSRMSENLLLLTMPTTMPNLSSCHQPKNKATNVLKK